MICIYHNKDLDGFCSGAIMKLKYPDATMIGYDYGQPLEIEVTGEPIMMADVSVPMKTMLKLAEISNWKFTWIDHHISAINEYKDFVGNGESFCNAVLDNSISACEATWKYLFPDKEMPETVRLLGEYDTWKNKDKNRWDNEILPFQYGMRVTCNSLTTFDLDLLNSFVTVDASQRMNDIIGYGFVVLNYQKQFNESQCRNSFETNFEGLRAICLNNGGSNSQLFDSVYDESKHDIMMPFYYNGKTKLWTISLYTTKDEIDCSVIAKKHGGGGHKKAAGFQVDKIESVLNL